MLSLEIFSAEVQVAILEVLGGMAHTNLMGKKEPKRRPEEA